MTGIAALAFLLAPAVAAASGTRDGVVKAAALSGFAALLIGALQFTGFVAPAPMAVELHLPFVLGCALMLATGFGLGGLRAAREADAVREEAERGRVRSKAFDAAPAALVACDGDGTILAASDGLRSLSPGLPRQLSGLPLGDLGFDEDSRSLLAAQARRAAQTPTSGQLQLRGASRDEADVRFETRPLPGGGSVGVLAEDRTPVLEARLQEAENAAPRPRTRRAPSRNSWPRSAMSCARR